MHLNIERVAVVPTHKILFSGLKGYNSKQRLRIGCWQKYFVESKDMLLLLVSGSPVQASLTAQSYTASLYHRQRQRVSRILQQGWETPREHTNTHTRLLQVIYVRKQLWRLILRGFLEALTSVTSKVRSFSVQGRPSMRPMTSIGFPP